MTSPLIVDVSSWQASSIASAAWVDLAARGAPWHGAILKATEGVGGRAPWQARLAAWFREHWPEVLEAGIRAEDRKSTRLNSSH